ncbi:MULTISPECIES: hypothetical protein [Mycobacterium]|uniref:Uncharacterized protein n=1 Tax=Mycobacterium kiyosense TaxID=2871094 RepID=A0A9P3UTJ0_9MYCO|nr:MULTISPECIES: hypothetical protein [Mycobacterium]BDB43873.1 hypothetical protein IWGMT90018_43190 [Mycobacterium kiyosense]BDE15429.1 hypothetical protein MKCMC460_42890 [Mycobacterium sp. 20KCMC460]GLB81145.1 hypothetical protein SRL2020028_04010 [Mycobacterium kiyosense]GLB90454.1 hypothetical protein SRL2020130_32710 [Mycobacterium kiyosense]GLB93626.1 hypothetical protein SRL2020226_04020 [Mycobacterium kiyosense]
MDIALLVIAALIVAVIGATVAVVAVVNRNQQRAITRDSQLIPGQPTAAPRSWARSHDPEARLHRRLRDAMTALHAANAFDTGSTVVLRADLEQTALAVDNQLIAVAGLAPAQRDELLQSIARTVESIEAAVGRYAAAATKPDTAALEADLAAVQDQLDVTVQLQRRPPESRNAQFE